MATQKIGLTKLGLKKNTSTFFIEWNNQVIEVKEYLPIQEKLDLVDRVIAQTIDEYNYVNPARLNIFLTLEIMYAYTNINFTEKQKEDPLALYDLLISSGLWDEINKKLCELNEFNIISQTVNNVIDGIYKYRDSVLGILDAVNQDYSNLNLEVDGIQKKLADPNNLTLVKDIVTKLG